VKEILPLKAKVAKRGVCVNPPGVLGGSGVGANLDLVKDHRRR